MSRNVYFFIDGGSLFADIAAIQQRDSRLQGRGFKLAAFVDYCKRSEEHFRSLTLDFGLRGIRLYAASGDDRLKRVLVLPPVDQPASRMNWGVVPCGGTLDPSVKKAARWLTKAEAPDYVTNLMRRREKGVDTQICCDALTLAAMGKLDRLILYTNDSDFVPLCRALRGLGTNCMLYRIPSPKRRVCKELATESDGYFEFPSSAIERLFEGWQPER